MISLGFGGVVDCILFINKILNLMYGENIFYATTIIIGE